MNVVLLVVSIILFVLAALGVNVSGVTAHELCYVGLACFAAAHLPLP